MFILLITEIPEEPEIVADTTMPTTTSTAKPIAPIFAIPTAPVSTGPSMFSFFHPLPYLRRKFILFTSWFFHTTFHVPFYA